MFELTMPDDDVEGPKPVKPVEVADELVDINGSVITKPVITLLGPLPDWDCKASLDFMLADLAKSGLISEDMGTYPVSLQAMGTTAAYIIPYKNPQMYRMRLDRAIDKYTQPKGLREVWSSPHQDVTTFGSESVLYIIEGEKKTAAFVKKWPLLAAFGIGGAHNALVKNPDGTKRLLDELVRAIKPKMRVVAIFDGDIAVKVGIMQAAHNLKRAVNQLGADLEVYIPPSGKGVDDWLVEDPTALINQLRLVPLTSLEESRKSIFVALDLIMNDNGKPILNEANATKILTYKYAATVFCDKRLGLITNQEQVNFEALEFDAVDFIQNEMLAHMSVHKIRYGLKATLSNNTIDLLQMKFRHLIWDNVPRLNTWASKYLETTFPAYANEWGRYLITGLTLRVLEPGTKVDKACILVGPQGLGKSTFFEELSTFDGHMFYHACTELAADSGDNNRTQGAAFAKAVVVDLAEGVIFENKKGLQDIHKQRITQVTDEYREVYALTTKIEKRGFIFVGTSNREDQLSDPTGSRRFLNILVSKLTKLPYAEKLQLIAEVVANEHQIRNSNWFDMVLTIDDAPKGLLEGREHIKDVQTLVNSQFQRPDVVRDVILELLDSNVGYHFVKAGHRPTGTDLLVLEGTRAVTAHSLHSVILNSGRADVEEHVVTRLISQLRTSPEFPYTFVHTKVAPKTLGIHTISGCVNFWGSYSDDTMKSRGSIYCVIPKPAHAKFLETQKSEDEALDVNPDSASVPSQSVSTAAKETLSEPAQASCEKTEDGS